MDYNFYNEFLLLSIFRLIYLPIFNDLSIISFILSGISYLFCLAIYIYVFIFDMWIRDYI